MQNIESFTNLYSLTKVVKFNLDPIPETKKWLKAFGKVFTHNHSENLEDNFFKLDLKIEDAKRIIQDVLNSVHEAIITQALESEEAKSINISSYYELSNQRNHDLSDLEQRLREQIKVCFIKQLKDFCSEVSPKKKNSDDENGLPDLLKMLGSSNMLDYLSKSASKYSSPIHDKKSIEDACKDLKGFWGVLDKYIKNRENYYVFDKEQDTAVATRIVSDLLPMFCKNCKQYLTNKALYDSIFTSLKSSGIIMQMINPKTNEMRSIESFDSSIYNISGFYKYISQSGIETYNAIISRNNILVNLYNQQQKKANRINGFVELHKQIGCRESESTERIVICKDWDSTESKELGISMESMIKRIICMVNETIVPTEPNILHPRVYNLISWLENAVDWDGIYVSDKALSIISSHYLEDWYSLQQLLLNKESVGTYNQRKESNEQFKLNSAVELMPVFRALDCKDFDSVFKKSIYNDYSDILNKNLPPSRNLINMLCHDVKQIINNELPIYTKCITQLLTTKISKVQREGFFKQEEIIDIIRDYLDCVLSIARFVYFFSVRQNKIKGAPYNMELLQIVSSLLSTELGNRRLWYDEVRNYLLKSPQDEVKENKLKLNFNSSSLLKGWSIGEERTKLSLLLKNEGCYYLCILKNDKTCKKLFDINTQNNIYIEHGNAYRMMLRNLSFKTLVGKGYVSMFGTKYSEEDDEVAIQHAKQLIRQNYLKNYPELSAVITKPHSTKSAFFADVDSILKDYAQCYYNPINWNLIEKFANEGNIYVFRIHAKDYKDTSKGKKDLQTIYWEDVLSGHSSHSLSAYGEVFRRDAISTDKTKPFIHKKGSVLINKRDIDGNSIPNSIYIIIYALLNKVPLPKTAEEKDIERAKSLIEKNIIISKESWMNIIKDARFYGEEKYFLHNPICFNYKSIGFKSEDFSKDIPYHVINPIIQELMHNSCAPTSFIGIDRGEKNLIYACKINSEGSILFCNHYNIVHGINYLEKLEERADSRLKAKRSWKQQESIKNLKEGYISHVVHQLLEDVISVGNENLTPSYIVLEKLSREMKRGRQKIEKQVYQKFELALASKLGFYVNKDIEEEKPGSIQMPLQFVPPVNTFDQIDKKDSFGIMLYTRANYTSVTDPLTGWRKTIYITNGNNEDILKELTEAFDDIFFDGVDYVFSYVEKNSGQRWNIYSGNHGKSLDRFEYNKDTKCYESYNIVEVLDVLFADFNKSSSLLEQMRRGVKLKKAEENRTAYDSLRKAINMIQQIRNTGNEIKDNNFLQSPIRKDGKHFDTRNANDFRDLNLHFIKDADANGAYNIARKGLIMDAHYKYWMEQGKPNVKKKNKKEKEVSALSLYVSDREWDMWLLNREMWEKHLSEFSLRKQD